jgi:ubiquitin carboxyl-terminal hydrolase 7
VYSIPAEAHTSAESLQRLFWNLEHDDDSVSTSALTKSFGWNIEDLAVQHDVQELLRKLVDKLEEKVKDSPQKGVFEQLFRGTYMDILKCINVDYERKQEIAFCDLSLNVAGCDTLEDSLRKFTETETLDGDNRYKSEEHGYQDAHKGIKLNSLPPVLHLHLKRFDYQYQNDPPTLEKVNAKQVFPPVLKMGEFLDKPIPDTDDTTYDLFGILVHSGSAQAGHYYAFLRPTTSPNWFKFDDSKVSHATVEEAIDDNFGGDEITEIKIGGKSVENAQRFATEKHSSAYMLVYVKKSEIDTVFSDTRFDSETPFVEKMTQEMKALQMEMQKRIEEAQYTEVRVSTMDCLISGPPSDYDGKLIHMFDLNKANKVRIKKDALVKHLKVEIERQLGIPAVRQRLWTLKENYDYYISLDRPITVENCNRTVLMFKSNRVSLGMEVTDLLDVFVEINDDIPTDPVDKEGESQPHLREEVDTGEDGEGESAGVKQRGFQNLEKTRLLFARYFNPEDQSFRVIGQFYFPEFHGTIDLLTDAIKPLLEREGLWTDDGELAFHLSDATTPMSDRLGNGELAMRQITAGAFITVQYLVPEDVTTIKHKTVTSYLRFLKSRISLEFHDLSNREVEPIALPFTTDTTMGEVLATLGSALGWDPKKISLIDAYPGTHHPRSTTPATFESDYTIQRAFSSATYFMHYGPVHIFYDLLDLPLDEIRGKVPAKVHFVDHKLVNHAVTLYMAPPYSAGQLAETARRNPRIAPLLVSPDIPLRVFEFEEHRFTYRAKQPTEQLYSYYSQHLGIEEVYPEETSALPNFSKVIIYLLSISSSGVYTKPTHRPFTLTIAPDETIASIKNRIRARVGNTTDEIDVWVRDPAYSETQACAENQVVSELEATGLYCNLHAPRPETPATTQTAATGPTVKEKPRNTLHLGN